MGTLRYCGQNAGSLRKQHGQCRNRQTTGIQEMTQLTAQATSAHRFKGAFPVDPWRNPPALPRPCLGKVDPVHLETLIRHY